MFFKDEYCHCMEEERFMAKNKDEVIASHGLKKWSFGVTDRLREKRKSPVTVEITGLFDVFTTDC